MAEPKVGRIPLDVLSDLELHNVEADVVDYLGRRALRVIEADDTDGHLFAMAVLRGTDFRDGTIKAEIAGVPREDAPEDMRGFVGIAFRVQAEGPRFECVFLRPTNGRADDQLRRNHSTQYISHPDHPWHRLREDYPGVYESYVDLVPGAWTSVRIAVSGTKARLFVHDADQPCLVVNDLKLGETHGSVGLWIGSGTQAHFSDVVIS